MEEDYFMVWQQDSLWKRHLSLWVGQQQLGTLVWPQWLASVFGKARATATLGDSSWDMIGTGFSGRSLQLVNHQTGQVDLAFTSRPLGVSTVTVAQHDMVYRVRRPNLLRNRYELLPHEGVGQDTVLIRAWADRAHWLLSTGAVEITPEGKHMGVNAPMVLVMWFAALNASNNNFRV